MARAKGHTTRIVRRSRIEVTPRVAQVRGIFDVQPQPESVVEFDVSLALDDLGDDWSIGAIIGPSGSGKTTIAREIFGDALIEPSGFPWPDDHCILDGFPEVMSIKDVTALLSRVGFASPPSWLRPFGVLSNGEQFRTNLARALASETPTIAVDEFTSVVDRQVAQVASHCVAKVVRRGQSNVKRFVAVTCHYDVIDWLQPDWMYEPGVDKLTRRSVQRRPDITLDIRPVGYEAWRIFAAHHYLTRDLNRTARCYVGFVNDRPAVMTAILPMPHGKIRNAYRSSRVVTLPDFQGLGLGPLINTVIGSMHKTLGNRFWIHPTHPSLIAVSARDRNWRMTREPGKLPGRAMDTKQKSLARTRARDRWTAGFEYVGPAFEDRLLADAIINGREHITRHGSLGIDFWVPSSTNA